MGRVARVTLEVGRSIASMACKTLQDSKRVSGSLQRQAAAEWAVKQYGNCLYASEGPETKSF